jgi:hypothetical protein
MQRTLVELLVKKGLMSKRTLCEEVRANYVAEREKIGEEAAGHLKIWMQELGCTDKSCGAESRQQVQNARPWPSHGHGYTQRGIPAASGGEWQAVQVIRVKNRLA